jgi:hypothetical protein
MEDNRVTILNDSIKIISKLQLLSVFFEDEMIYKIYLRSQVIHQLFEHNQDLDINKLELFHLQFTASTIDLLKKIKQSNERQTSLMLDEIYLNKEMIERLDGSEFTEKTFAVDMQRQAGKINTSLRNLYMVLSEEKDTPPLSKNIRNFSNNYAGDFFHDVPRALLEQAITFDEAKVYRNPYAVIQRRLMGLLCKHEFRTTFVCGLKADEIVAEIYKFSEEESYYLFVPARNLFLLCDAALIANVDLNNTLSKKERIVQELQEKNDRLQAMVELKKKYMPVEIKKLLGDNCEKISDVNFLQNIENFDAQANILRSMLNTDFM